MKNLMSYSLGELFAIIQRLQDRIRNYKQQITSMQRRIEALKNLSARQHADLQFFSLNGVAAYQSDLFHELERERDRRLKAEAELDAMVALTAPYEDEPEIEISFADDEEFDQLFPAPACLIRVE